jgi:tetratricopeptide (TPR) repeat protein
VGTLALLQDEPVAAAEAYRSALTEARAAGAEADEPRVLHDLGVALRRAGQADDAKRILLEALDAARRVRTRPLEAKILNELGELSRALGAPKAARDHYAGAVAIWEARGDHQAFVGRLNLALTDVESDRSARAVRSLEGLAARPEGIPDRWRVPYALTSAFAFASSGNHDSAESELDVAVYLLLGARANPPEARAMITLIQALWQADNDVTRADRAALMLTQLAADN